MPPQLSDEVRQRDVYVGGARSALIFQLIRYLTIMAFQYRLLNNQQKTVCDSFIKTLGESPSLASVPTGAYTSKFEDKWRGTSGGAKYIKKIRPLYRGLDATETKNSAQEVDKRFGEFESSWEKIVESDDVGVYTAAKQLHLGSLFKQWTHLLLPDGPRRVADTLWDKGQLDSAKSIADLGSGLGQMETGKQITHKALNKMREAGVLPRVIVSEQSRPGLDSMASRIGWQTFDPFRIDCSNPMSALGQETTNTCTCPEDPPKHYRDIRQDLYEKHKQTLASAASRPEKPHRSLFSWFKRVFSPRSAPSEILNPVGPELRRALENKFIDKSCRAWQEMHGKVIAGTVRLAIETANASQNMSAGENLCEASQPAPE